MLRADLFIFDLQREIWASVKLACKTEMVFLVPVADGFCPQSQQEIRASVELVRKTKMLGRLPVVNFAAGGVATPADAALMMQV